MKNEKYQTNGLKQKPRNHGYNKPRLQQTAQTIEAHLPFSRGAAQVASPKP